VVGLFSIGANLYNILKILDVAGGSNNSNMIYHYLDLLFGYKLTIPSTELKVYTWYLFIVISWFMAIYMAYSFTFIFDMWRSLPRVIPYAFTLLSGFSIVFFSHLLLSKIVLNFIGINFSIIIIIYSTKIIGWLYGFSKIGNIGRKEMQSKWNLYLIHGIDGDRISDKKGRSICIRALNDDDKNVRSASAHTLNSLRGYDALQPLIKSLNDEVANVRLNAARALGNIESEEAVVPLIIVKNQTFYTNCMFQVYG